MSADRDYWTELKQLLRWFITPGLPPGLSGSFGLVQLVQAPASYLGTYQFVGACLVWFGLVQLIRAHPAFLGLSILKLTCPDSSGLSGFIRLVWACPARFGSFRLILVPGGSSWLVQSVWARPGSYWLVQYHPARPGSSGLIRAWAGPPGKLPLKNCQILKSYRVFEKSLSSLFSLLP